MSTGCAPTRSLNRASHAAAAVASERLVLGGLGHLRRRGRRQRSPRTRARTPWARPLVLGGLLGGRRLLPGHVLVRRDAARGVAEGEPAQGDEHGGVHQPGVRRVAGGVGHVEDARRGCRPRPAAAPTARCRRCVPSSSYQTRPRTDRITDASWERVARRAARDEGAGAAVGDGVARDRAVAEGVDADPVDALLVGHLEQLHRHGVGEGRRSRPGSSSSTVSNVPGTVTRSPTYSAGSMVDRLGERGGGRDRRLGGEGVQVDPGEGLVADVGDGAGDLDVAAARQHRADGVDVHQERVGLLGRGGVRRCQRAARRPRRGSGAPPGQHGRTTGGARTDVRCSVVPDRHVEWPVVSDAVLAPAHDRRDPAPRRRGADAHRIGHRRARRAVRRGRRGAGAGRRPGARRDARPPAERPRLHHLRPPRGDRAARGRVGRRGVGHGARLRHDRVPQGRVAGGDHDLPLRDLRPVLAQARRRLRRHPRRRPRSARLHGQLDGGAGAEPRVRRPVRRRRRPRRAGAAHARHAGGLLLRRPAADDARRALRRPARLHRRPRGGRGDDRDGRADRDHLRRAGARRAGQAGLRPAPAARPDAAGRDRPGRARAARAARAGARARRAPPPQGRLRAHPDGARAVDRPRAPPRRPPAAPTSSPASPRSCTTSASRAPAASRPAAS